REFLRRKPPIQRISSTLVCLKSWTVRDLSMRCTDSFGSGFRVQGSGFFGLGTLNGTKTLLAGVMEYFSAKRIVLLFIAGGLQFTPSITAAERIRTSVPGLNLNYLSIFSADAKGFFKEEGLENETVVIGGPAGIAALVSGDVDFSGAGGSGLRAAIKG